MKSTIFSAIAALAVVFMATAAAPAHEGHGGSYDGNCPHCGDNNGACGNGACGNGNCGNGNRGNGNRRRGNCQNGNCGNGNRRNGGYDNTHLPYGSPYRVGRRAQAALAYPWHCNYYHTEWGSPVALVVPPTAERQYSMGWGVGNTRLTRIHHQFGRPYPGEFSGDVGRQFQATPNWPSDTSQFGVYYVRGPW